MFKKFYEKFQKDPDKFSDSVIAFAGKLGIRTNDVKDIMAGIIGREIMQLGLIEKRQYQAQIIEYSAFISVVDNKKRLILRILDTVNISRFIDYFMSADFSVTYCSLSQRACNKFSEMLSSNEKTFS